MIGNKTYTIINKVLLRSMLLLLAVMLIKPATAQNNNTAIMNARIIMLCAKNIEWKNYKRPKELSITVLGKTTEEYTALTAAAEGQKINGIPIRVYRKTLNELVPTDIIFVNKNYADDLEAVNDFAKNNKCLVFGGKLSNTKFVAINIRLESGSGVSTYDINPANFNEDAAPTDSLWNFSGSTEDLKRRYKVNSDELAAREKRLQDLEKTLNDQEKQLLAQKNKNQLVKQQNDRIEAQLDQNRKEIELQKTKASALVADVRQKERQIVLTAAEIANSMREIEIKQLEIDSSNQKLQEMDLDLQQKDKDIKAQIDRIQVEDRTIATQEQNRTYLIVFISVVVILLIIIIKSLINSKKTNAALKVKNK
ncbi:MAG: DUF4154 domain-containing protein, partial [Bacteroidales bacterium]|nr:DUF4154 domain-containing protein [Bacteroidales bacterium]